MDIFIYFMNAFGILSLIQNLLTALLVIVLLLFFLKRA